MNIELSIIVLVYNVEQYLEECLDSIYAVEKIKKEIILVNDGSTDGSLEILKRYKEKYPDITVLIDKKNGGLSSARNAGIKVARGEYISFIDSDDWIDSKKYEKFFKEGQKYNLDIMISYGRIEVNSKKEKIENIIYSEKEYTIVSGKEFIEKNFLKRNFRHEVWDKIFKRNLIIENKIYFREDIIYEDELFTPIAFMCAERVQKIDKCFYNYRNREGSIMNSFRNDHFQSKFKIYYSLMFNKKNCSKILIKKYFWLYQTYFSKWNILYIKQHLKLLFLPNLTFQDRLWLLKVLKYVKEVKWSIEKEI